MDDLGNGLAVFGTTVLPLEKNTLEGIRLRGVEMPMAAV